MRKKPDFSYSLAKAYLTIANEIEEGRLVPGRGGFSVRGKPQNPCCVVGHACFIASGQPFPDDLPEDVTYPRSVIDANDDPRYGLSDPRRLRKIVKSIQAYVDVICFGLKQ